MNREKINLILNCCFIFLFFLLFSLNFYTSQHLVFSDDAVGALFFAENITKKGTLFYNDPLNSQFGQIFGLRGFIILPNNQTASSYMLGNIILTSFFLSISKISLYFFNFIFSSLALFFFYKTINLFLEDNIKSKIITMFLTFFAPFLFYASVFTNVLPATAFFIMGSYFSLKFVQKAKERYLYLFLIFNIFSIWVRYEYILLSLPFFCHTLYSIRNKNINFKYSYVLWSLLIVVLLIFPFIYYNLVAFGSISGFIHPSGTILGNFELSTAIKEGGVSFFRNWDNLFVNIKTQIISNFIFIPITFVLYLVSLILIIKRGEYALLAFFFIPVIQIFYYFGNNWGGYNTTGTVGGSALFRYLLPSWMIMFFLASYSLITVFGGKHNIINRKIITILIAIFIVFNLNFVFFSHWGLRDYRERIQKMLGFRKEILKNTPENSILFFKFLDKEVFPLRETAIYQSFPPQTRINQTTGVIRNLINNGYDVYFIDEDKITKGGDSFEGYKENFEKEGLDVLPAFSSNVYQVDFYKVAQKK